MNVTLQREKSTEQSTPGKLHVDGQFFSFSLEDVVRDVKIKGITAIPAGRYKLAHTFSQRFQKFTLELLDVPNFTGVRIHGGNDSGDTSGCLLLGMVRLSPDRIRDCASAVIALERRFDAEFAAGNEVWIDIENFAPQTMGFGIADE